MMEKIEKLKQGKIDPNQLLKSFSKETPQSIGILNNDSVKGNNSSINEHSKVGITSHKAASLNKDIKRAQKTQPNKKSEEEIKKDLNNLIEKQNSEMLKLLEDQQELENQREARFSRANADEKRKLEKDFGMERARAQMRIQKLSEYFLIYLVLTLPNSKNSKYFME